MFAMMHYTNSYLLYFIDIRQVALLNSACWHSLAAVVIWILVQPESQWHDMHCKFQDDSITVYRVITCQVEKIPGLFQTNEIEQMHKFVNTDSTSIFFSMHYNCLGRGANSLSISRMVNLQQTSR